LQDGARNKIIEMTKKTQIKNQSLQIPKPILLTAKLLQAISPKLATLFAAKLFTTPLKHKIPKRELEMDSQSKKERLWVPKIAKEIQVYRYGMGAKKVLLVHGWSGRGTQLVKIANLLVAMGYEVVSFDAPAHGNSAGHSTLMPEFIASIMVLEKTMGPFEYAIGHSLGGMSLLTSLRRGLLVKKAVIIGSGDIIQDIIDAFIARLSLKPNIGLRLKEHFEKQNKEEMESYSSHVAAQFVSIPTLIVHDQDDDEVSVKAAYSIHKHLLNSELLITEGLGHRKILGDEKVLQRIKQFLEK
jgi:pimeloyl-ACP methyl ester carboxylesterase